MLPKLNGLRALSAFIVVVYHYGFYVPAGFGVLTFFVMSGFLITWLLLKEHDRTGSVSLRAFLAVILLSVAGVRIIWPQAWASFFYVANYYQGLNGYPSSAFSHTWSLGIEEQFYLLWPLAFLLLGNRPRLTLARLIGCIAAINVYRIILHSVGVPEEYIYTALDTRLDHLLVGCAIAVALKHRMGPRVWEVVARRDALPVIVGLLASIICGKVYGIPYRNTIGIRDRSDVDRVAPGAPSFERRSRNGVVGFQTGRLPRYNLLLNVSVPTACAVARRANPALGWNT